MQQIAIQLAAPLAGVRSLGSPAGAPGQEGGAEILVEPEDLETTRLRLETELRQQFELETAGLRQARGALAAAASRLTDLSEQIVAEAETQVVDLALEIARKVVMQEIQNDRIRIDPIVQEALSRLPGMQQVVVYLNPADLDRSEAAGEADSSGCVRYVANVRVRRGEALLETRDGTVESSVDEHLENIADALKAPE